MPDFDGQTYEHDRDHTRLTTLFERVFHFMSDGKWHSLDEIQGACGGTVASVSARLRDFRKKKFGGYHVEREYINDGLYQYRLIRN